MIICRADEAAYGIMRKQSVGDRELTALQPAICGASDRIWQSRKAESGNKSKYEGRRQVRVGVWSLDLVLVLALIRIRIRILVLVLGLSPYR